MLIKEFNSLTKVEKVVLVLEKGEKISQRNVDEFLIKLFLTDGVFVELWYNTEKDLIVKVKNPNLNFIISHYAELSSEMEKLISKSI